MTHRLHRRLRNVAHRMDSMPVARHLVDQGIEDLRSCGELPVSTRIAAAVVHRVLYGLDDDRPLDRAASIRRILCMTIVEGTPAPTPMREHLFDEALYGQGFVRRAARTALKCAAFLDQDVTSPRFLSEMPPPAFGSVGMRLVGFPERWVRPPYFAQADRLWGRFANLRARISDRTPTWLDQLAEAALRFRSCLQLPDDDLMADAVLADLELEAILAHAHRVDVAGLMAILDRLARASTQRRSAALADLMDLLRTSPPPGFGIAS
jgi:hypothetical protein